jgi:synaptojanin
MSIRVLLQDLPHRTLALTTDDHALVFRHAHSAGHGSSSSSISLTVQSSNRQLGQSLSPRCMVEFAPHASLDFAGYRTIGIAQGTLGLITLNGDVFLCTVTDASQVATPRPGETVQKIQSVDFCKIYALWLPQILTLPLDCLNRSEYEHGHGQEPHPYHSQESTSDDIDYGGGPDQTDITAEHPFHALQKLLNSGNFYYSVNFDLTSRLQDR